MAIAVPLLHFAEEYATGFTVAFPELLGTEPTSPNTFLVFNMSAYVAFVFGGPVICPRARAPMMIPLFFIGYRVTGNASTHTVLAIVVGGTFRAPASSLLYCVFAPLLVRELCRSTR